MSERSGAAASSRRVALVLASSTGGIGRHVASLAGGLAGRGAEVTVCGPADTDRQFEFGTRGARFVPVEIPASPQPRDAAAVHALRRALRGHAPDVVHAHGLRAGLVAALARPTGCPLVVTWHNQILAHGMRGRVYRQLEGYVARAADITLGASGDLVGRAAALGARDARLGAVAAPELAPPTRSPEEVRADLGIEPGRPLVLSVGRLHPQKGYDVLVAAASRWRSRQPAPAVVIAGSGPSYMRLAAQISHQHAPVILAGHRTDVPDLLAAADLAVVTSVWEARQLFAQEAMRAGTPLVATSVGGLPDLVGDDALLIAPGDVDALDAAVTSLLDDPALRAAYGRRAGERAATWPTEADTLAQVQSVYDELTDRVRAAGQEAR
ncbi:glycosyltransferase family 4 protein [Planosporangium sp. 12N6]|uniref:glycosyltransferase family 4 protein n=1 Tax=Planosporangium spinosum TaxID=3402278 RepID=UPI003CF2E9B0